MIENFESMECSRSYVFSMWGKSIKVAVLLAFFFCGTGLMGLEQKDIGCACLLWQLDHGVWLRQIFPIREMSGGVLQRRCGVSKSINKWAPVNSYHKSRLSSGRSMRRQKLPFTVWWSLVKDVPGRKEQLSRMALHRSLQPLPGSKYSSLPPFLPFSCQLAPHCMTPKDPEHRS